MGDVIADPFLFDIKGVVMDESKVLGGTRVWWNAKTKKWVEMSTERIGAVLVDISVMAEGTANSLDEAVQAAEEAKMCRLDAYPRKLMWG